MKIRIAYTVEFSDKAIAAYVRYHGEEALERSGLRESIRASYEQNGKMGVEEQLYEGGKWLEADAERADEDRDEDTDEEGANV